MFKQVIPLGIHSTITPENVLDEDRTNTDPDYNLIRFCIAFGVKKKWQIGKPDIPVPTLILDDIEKYAENIADKGILENEYTKNKFVDLFILANDHIMVDEINKEYKEYKDSYKKVGNFKNKKKCKIIDFDGVEVKSSIDSFAQFMKERRHDKIMSYHQIVKQWNWLDSECYKHQFKIWRQHYKTKKELIHIFVNTITY